MADKVAKEFPELAKDVAHGKVSLPQAIKQIEARRRVLRAKTGPKADAVREELRQASQRGVSMLWPGINPWVWLIKFGRPA